MNDRIDPDSTPTPESVLAPKIGTFESAITSESVVIPELVFEVVTTSSVVPDQTEKQNLPRS